MLSSAWFIARKDIAFMLRQKETLLWTFLMPLIFMYFIGTMTSGMGRAGGSEERPDWLGLDLQTDGGFLLDELVKRLEAQNFKLKKFEPGENREQLEKYTRRLTIPKPKGKHQSFTAAVLAGEETRLAFHNRSQGMGRNFDQVRVARAVYGLLADLAVLAQQGKDKTQAAIQELAATGRNLRLVVKPAGKRKTIPSGFSQAVPATMIMFTMLVLLTGGAIWLVIEREQGLLRRLASTPISRGSVLLGKWVGKLFLGLIQIAFAMLAGTFLFDVDWGNALPMLLVLLAAWAAFNTSLGLVLANLARSEAQMSGIGVLTSLVLAALGGCWWPIEITPGWMQQLALCLPTGWAMDGMHKLVNFGEGAATVLPHVVVLLFGSLVLGWAAARRFRYQ